MNVDSTKLIALRLATFAGVLVIGAYAYTAPLGRLESLVSKPSDAYYNLLVQGFGDGHLSLKKEVPAGFSHLANPYDPDANRPYRGLPYELNDQSYYKGRLYLYFGVTPALILFWPFVLLTGHYLTSRLAVTIFCAVGIAVSLGLLRAIWQRYFPEVSVWVVALCALALGLATGVPMLLPQSDIYQVPISCGYMLAMVALGAIWCALHNAERRTQWMAAASVAYGLAVGARPNLLFGAVILLLPVGYARRERQSIWATLLAATVPILLIGFGLMLYNDLRFDNPFEFGLRYQLNGLRLITRQYLSPRFLWINFRVYFLEPAHWSVPFPFVHKAATPPLPSGYSEVQDAFGVLTNIPLVWLALAVPLAWRERNALRWFLIAVGLLFGTCALALGFYCNAADRYQIEFLPALVLLAVVGILGLERALVNQPGRRCLVRCGWGGVLVFSVVFNMLVSAKNYAYAGGSVGRMLLAKGRVPEAIQVFENVVRIKPDYPEGHDDLGATLWQAGRRQEAIQEYKCALRLNPDYADAHLNLGVALVELGRPADAVRHYEQALQINPDYAEAHNDLGNALLQTGKPQEAIAQYEQALRIKPDYADAHFNLGNSLLQIGKQDEAMEQYRQILKINPDFADAHLNLGIALYQNGKTEEAIENYEYGLRLKPNDLNAHYNFGLALEKMNRLTEAIDQYEQALKIRPDFTEASNALARLQATQTGR